MRKLIRFIDDRYYQKAARSREVDYVQGTDEGGRTFIPLGSESHLQGSSQKAGLPDQPTRTRHPCVFHRVRHESDLWFTIWLKKTNLRAATLTDIILDIFHWNMQEATCTRAVPVRQPCHTWSSTLVPWSTVTTGTTVLHRQLVIGPPRKTMWLTISSLFGRTLPGTCHNSCLTTCGSEKPTRWRRSEVEIHY